MTEQNTAERAPRRPRSRAYRRAAPLILAAALVVPVSMPTGAPRAAAVGSLQTIALEAVNNAQVTLGALGSRSQRNPVTISGIGPYTMSGTDSITGLPYSYDTDVYFNPGNAAYTRESDQRSLRTAFNGASATGVSYDGHANVVEMTSHTNCASGNTFGGLTTYCSEFGPDVYSVPFSAAAAQAVSFQWSAVHLDDDYEIYAFLVAVTETSPGSGTYDHGSAASTTLLTYGRGGTQGWTTTSGTIPTTGEYRFRFVNGTYDGTGGYALGSAMYIDNVVKVGQANPITFAALPDVLANSAPFTLAATSPGGAVTFSTSTPGTCSVNGTTVAPAANRAGVCTIVADQPGDGIDYIPADTVTQSFSILPVAPTNTGVPIIVGTPLAGSTVTVTPGTWNDGGSPITTTIQWRSSVGGTTADLAGINGPTCNIAPLAGSTISVEATATNSVGSASAHSIDTISGYTCAPSAAPGWTDSTLPNLQEGVSVIDGVSADGYPYPTYGVTSGSLPAGLNLDSVTGAITGAPVASGAYAFTVTASNGTLPDVDQAFAGDIAPPDSAPSWFDSTLGGMQRAVAFADGVSASGYPAPTYSVTAGALPPGLIINSSTGTVTGSPTTAGAYAFTITATNSTLPSISRQFTGTVLPADSGPGWSDTTIADMQQGVVFNDGVSAGGYPAPTYMVTGGALPNGSVLDPTTGAITGTPTAAGAYDFTITASNSTQPDVSHQFIGEVLPLSVAPSWTDSTLGGLQQGEVLNDGVTAGGYPAPTYSISAGTLPAGLTLDATTGTITGTPTTAGAYAFTITASNTLADVTRAFTGTVATPAATPAATPVITPVPGFVAMAPVRLVDTRTASSLAMQAGSTYELAIGGRPDVPDDATAVILSVTAVDPTGSGFITVFPCGTPMPLASNVNYRAGTNTANAVTTALGAGGKVCIYSRSAIDLVVDLDGAYSPTHGSGNLIALAPLRLLDTRDTGIAVQAAATYELTVGGQAGVPSDATAVVLNVTAADPTAAGFITVYPCGSPVPLASNVNYRAGVDSANAVTTALGAGGKVCFYTQATIDLVVDLDGAYSPTQGAGSLVTVSPVRLADTRAGVPTAGERINAGTTYELTVGGATGVPSDATAVIVNVTAADPTGSGFLTVYPCGSPVPLASNVNFGAGVDSANAVTTALGKAGKVCFYTQATIDLVVDLDGYQTGAA
ncbi:MAG: hypothetical protein JWM34_1637 [Ilumatobacteraceae bacterium]|nr:hypothetical protein [Ilumatobacteraceae bacterium]